MKLIVGLGNPGKEYDKTRHNVGFMVIDNYCRSEIFQTKFNGLYLMKIYDGEKVIFLKPLSYMNLSGTVVSKYVNFFKIKYEDILIIRDDLDLALGTAKIKYDSSSGGDNGIKSIIAALGTKTFGQLKIGISNDKTRDTKDYVLGRFTNREQEILEKIINKTPIIIESFIKNGIEKTMSEFNGALK